MPLLPSTPPPAWVVGGPHSVPAVRSILRDCSDAAWSVTWSCRHSVHVLLQETHRTWPLRVSSGFGLLMSWLWESAIADLGAGWLPPRRKPTLCVGDSLLVSAFSLLSLACLGLSHWHLLLTAASHFALNSLRCSFTFPSGVMLRMSWMCPPPAHPPSPAPLWHSPPASFCCQPLRGVLLYVLR